MDYSRPADPQNRFSEKLFGNTVKPNVNCQEKLYLINTQLGKQKAAHISFAPVLQDTEETMNCKKNERVMVLRNKQWSSARIVDRIWTRNEFGLVKVRFDDDNVIAYIPTAHVRHHPDSSTAVECNGIEFQMSDANGQQVFHCKIRLCTFKPNIP